MGLRPPRNDAWVPDETVLAGMRAFNAPPEQIEIVRANIERQRAALPQQLDHFPVWACNWPVLLAFLAVETQWQRNAFSGHITGLDYRGVQAWLDMRYLSRRKRRDIFEGLQIMERAALDALPELPKETTTKT